MIGGLACYGLVAFLYVFASTLPQVFVVRLLHGLGAGMIWPALSAFVIDLSPVERRGETMGVLSAVEMVGFAVGPFLGGVLYSLGGMNAPFLGLHPSRLCCHRHDLDLRHRSDFTRRGEIP